jgi:hypothetical protein
MRRCQSIAPSYCVIPTGAVLQFSSGGWSAHSFGIVLMDRQTGSRMKMWQYKSTVVSASKQPEGWAYHYIICKKYKGT